MDTADSGGGESGTFSEEMLRSLTTFGGSDPSSAEPLSHFTAAPPESGSLVGQLFGPRPAAGPPPLPAELVNLMAGHVEVDLEGAERFASDLALGVASAQDLLARAGELEVTEAAAHDAVSITAAAAMSQWGAGDPGRMLPALQAYLQRLDGAVAAYRQNIAAHRRTEETNAASYRGGAPMEGG